MNKMTRRGCPMPMHTASSRCTQKPRAWLHARPGCAGPGFTLVEILVVLGIIAVLVSLAMVVGSKVTQGGRTRATADVIRVLDESRGAWELNADQSLPASLFVEDKTGNKPKTYEFPLIDARIDAKDYSAAPWPSAIYYTALVMQAASVKPIFAEIDPTFAKPTTAPLPDPKSGQSQSWALRGLDMRDAWGRPMRIVHPTYHGGYGDYWDPTTNSLLTNREPIDLLLEQGSRLKLPLTFRRSWRPFRANDPARRATWVGDADEGMCVGNTPYFYSAGADGDPGNRKSNVYSTRPRFPVETKGFK